MNATTEELHNTLKALNEKATAMQAAIDAALLEYRLILVSMNAIQSSLDARLAAEQAKLNSAEQAKLN